MFQMKKKIGIAAGGSFFLPGVMPVAAAQCSMCRTTASLTAGVFDSAILVLFIPAIVLFGGIFFMAFRYWPDNEGDGGRDSPGYRVEKEITGGSLKHDRS
jgi:hypothetical protein